MARFIDRAELFNRLSYLQTFDNHYKAELYTIIGEMPAVDPKETKRAKWIFGVSNHSGWMKCSECLVSQMPTSTFTFCPNCGADMGEVES